MDPARIERDGKEWERSVKLWLHLRYPAGQFEEVPSEHHGDFGLEGFSRDGIAYQCYAVREELKVAQLYENQRKKITEDIHKFVARQLELKKLFGQLKIKSWWLVVPEHKSAKLVQHAEQKAQEVRQANLSYVGDAFIIHVANGYLEFELERAAARRAGIEQLRLDAAEIDSQEISDWADGNDAAVATLDGKVKRVVVTDDANQVHQYRNETIKLYRGGANMLERLRSRAPEIWESIDLVRKQRERAVQWRCRSQTVTAGDLITAELTELSTKIARRVPNLHEDNIDEIATGIVCDWMIRCPMDFRSQRNESA
jgi:hypothetical protein